MVNIYIKISGIGNRRKQVYDKRLDFHCERLDWFVLLP